MARATWGLATQYYNWWIGPIGRAGWKADSDYAVDRIGRLGRRRHDAVTTAPTSCLGGTSWIHRVRWPVALSDVKASFAMERNCAPRPIRTRCYGYVRDERGVGRVKTVYLTVYGLPCAVAREVLPCFQEHPCQSE
jgi:hypothetical protein